MGLCKRYGSGSDPKAVPEERLPDCAAAAVARKVRLAAGAESSRKPPQKPESQRLKIRFEIIRYFLVQMNAGPPHHIMLVHRVGEIVQLPPLLNALLDKRERMLPHYGIIQHSLTDKSPALR